MPKTEITYTKVGDYLIPDLILPPKDDTRHIGIWRVRVFGGHLCRRQKHRPSRQARKRHYEYLKNHRNAVYSIMLIDNTLHTHLADINEQAEDMFFRLVKDMAKSEGITEQLKSKNQMEWVGRMNNIRNRATEIVNAQLIYI